MGGYGRILRTAEQYDASVEMIPRALDLYSSNADLLSDRASWYVKQDEFQLAKRDLVHSVALNDFEATLSLNAELSDVYLDRGILHFMPGA